MICKPSPKISPLWSFCGLSSPCSRSRWFAARVSSKIFWCSHGSGSVRVGAPHFFIKNLFRGIFSIKKPLTFAKGILNYSRQFRQSLMVKAASSRRRILVVSPLSAIQWSTGSRRVHGMIIFSVGSPSARVEKQTVVSPLSRSNLWDTV